MVEEKNINKDFKNSFTELINNIELQRFVKKYSKASKIKCYKRYC